MSWPDGFAAGCRLLESDTIYHVIAAINERCAWLNAVRGAEVLPLLDVPARFLNMSEYMALTNLISQRVYAMGNHFFARMGDDDWVVPFASQTSQLQTLYGSPVLLRARKMYPHRDAEWLYCIYSWLQRCIYPFLEMGLQCYYDTLREAVEWEVNAGLRSIYYTSSGSTATLPDGSILPDYAYFGDAATLPDDFAKAKIDGAYAQSGSIFGWRINTITNMYRGWYLVGTSSQMRRKTRCLITRQRLSLPGNYFTSPIYARMQYQTFGKVDYRSGSFVYTPYPESGTYAYFLFPTGEQFSNAEDVPEYNDTAYEEDENLSDTGDYGGCYMWVTPRAFQVRGGVNLPVPEYIYF